MTATQRANWALGLLTVLVVAACTIQNSGNTEAKAREAIATGYVSVKVAAEAVKAASDTHRISDTQRMQAKVALGLALAVLRDAEMLAVAGNYPAAADKAESAKDSAATVLQGVPGADATVGSVATQAVTDIKAQAP